jgi:hypothetical protein
MDDQVFWSPGATGEAGDRALHRALTKALADLRHAAAALERRTEEAPEAELRAEVEAERAALEALAHTDRALVELLHAEPHLLGRQALSDIGGELDAASRSLHAYEEARARSQRLKMIAAARALRRASTLAAAILDEAGLSAAR